MASIQRLVSTRTGEISYRVQVRPKGRATETATFPNLKEAKAWAVSIEAAVREARHFPYAAARRTSFDALAKDYVETVLADEERAVLLSACAKSEWRALRALARPAWTGLVPKQSSSGGKDRLGKIA